MSIESIVEVWEVKWGFFCLEENFLWLLRARVEFVWNYFSNDGIVLKWDRVYIKIVFFGDIVEI